MAYTKFEQTYVDAYLNNMYPDVEEEQPQDTMLASAPTAEPTGQVTVSGFKPQQVRTDVQPELGVARPIPQNKAQEALGYIGELLTKAGVQLDKVGLDIPVLGRISLKDLTVGESGKVLEDMALGFYPVEGSGGFISGTTRIKPDPALELLNIVPIAGAAAKAGGKAVVKGATKAVQATKGMPIGMSIKMVDGTEQVLEQAPKITTKAFKNWFGNSKAVDDAGKPIVVYHSTRGQFDEFNTTGEGQSLNTGTFFSSSPDVASTYNTSSEHSIVPAYLSLKNPVVIDANGANWNSIGQDAKISLPEVKVSAKEDEMLLSELTGKAPNMDAMTTLQKRDTTAKELFGETVFEKGFSTNEIARWARGKGYDGVIFKNVVDHGPAARFSTKESEKPSNIYVAFEPTQIKSAIANKGTFDPKDPSILKGVAVGGAGAAMQQEDNK
jgi:hypothetical protein